MQTTSTTTVGPEGASVETLVSVAGDRTIGHEALAQPAQHLASGAMVNGRYRIETFVSEGGMGAVYRAADLAHEGRVVALKTLLGRRVHDTRIGLFMAEFRTMATLRHPNVAAVYDFEAIEQSADFLYSMEFIAGSELLAATVHAGREQVLEYIVQVCRALAYLHSRKIVHFDLKPANVLVANNVAKVLDFGLAGARPTLESGHVVGTPHYMAPELSARDRALDHRVDLYSLGIMMFHLLCRRLPFQAEGWLELMALHQVEPIRFTKDEEARLPEWLRDIISRLCAKDPSDRFRSANAVIEAINRGGGLSYEIDTRETKESYLFSSRFVGREQPYEQLVSFVAQRCEMRANGPQPMLLVGGQSGVGKSRLMREVRHHTQLSRQSFLETDCYEGNANEYAPISELLAAVARLLDAAGGADLLERFGPQLVKIAPELGRDRRIAPAAILDNPENERRVVLDAVTRFFVEAVHRVPCVLYINDLQWASASTIEILRLLLEGIVQAEASGKRVAIALLGSFRDDEVKDRPIERLIASPAHEPVLSLSPIAADQVARMIESMLGSEAPNAFAARVAGETGGNPFFIEEVVRALIENGSVFIRDGAWAAATEISKLDIPASIDAVFRRRAAQLDATERELLELIALFSRPLPAALLERIWSKPSNELYNGLSGLEQRQMIQHDGRDGLSYRTTHDRVRQTVCADLGARMQAVHARLAQGIDAAIGDHPGDWVYDLAHHYWHAGPTLAEKACAYNLKAGAAAASAYASAKAAEFYERALTLIPEERKNERFEAEEKLADLLCLIGQLPRSIAIYQRLSTPDLDVVTRARLVRKIGEAEFQQGESQEAFGKFVQVIEILGGSTPPQESDALYAAIAQERGEQEKRRGGQPVPVVTDPAEKRRLMELGEAYNKMGYILYWAGQYEAGFLNSTRAVNVLEQVGHSPMLATNFGAYGWFFGSMSQFDTARVYFDLAWQVATEIDSPLSRGVVAAQRAGSRYLEGRLEDSLADTDIAIESLTETGDLMHLFYAYASRTLTQLLHGHTRLALKTTAVPIDFLERIGTRNWSCLAVVLAAWARARLGELDADDEAYCRRVIGWLLKENDLLIGSLAQAVLAEVLRLAGREDEADAALEEARSIRDRMKMTNDYNSMLYAPFARRSIEKFKAGKVTREQAEAAVKEAGETGRKFTKQLSAALVVEALWADANGDTASAKKSFYAAIAEAEARGLRVAWADAHYHAGASALERGDGDSARRHLDAARERYAACECVVDARRCEALLQRCNDTTRA